MMPHFLLADLLFDAHLSEAPVPSPPGPGFHCSRRGRPGGTCLAIKTVHNKLHI